MDDGMTRSTRLVLGARETFTRRVAYGTGHIRFASRD
jgi:hypothetical protein